MTSYRGDMYLSQGGDSIAGAVQQYFSDRKESQGLDTAIETLAKARADDPDFQKKFLPEFQKAGGMSLSQKRNLVGTVAGYMGQRFQEQQQAQTARFQQAQMDNYTADNQRAEQAAADQRAGEEAAGTVVRNYLNAPLPVTNRMGYALNSTTVAPRHLPQVLRALQAMEPKALAGEDGLSAGQVANLEGGGRLIGVGGKGRPYFDPGNQEDAVDYGKGRPVTGPDGKEIPGYVWVPTSKGGGQILTTGGETPVTQQVNGVTYIKQPNGHWTPVQEPRRDAVSDWFEKFGGGAAPAAPAAGSRTNAPAAPAKGISWDDFQTYQRR